MNIKEITKIAISRGIKPRKLNKSSLIRSIQITDGNFGCFGTAYDGECDQHKCAWRTDCFGHAAKQKH